ncbi:hypothetical protein D3C81_2062980 [compost metagenome]
MARFTLYQRQQHQTQIAVLKQAMTPATAPAMFFTTTTVLPTASKMVTTATAVVAMPLFPLVVVACKSIKHHGCYLLIDDMSIDAFRYI